MIPDQTRTDAFSDFVRDVEPRLRVALCSLFGVEAGREATAEALAYGWEHWDRLSGMDNPAGYLYTVGRSRGRRRRKRGRRTAMFDGIDVNRLPWVEPGLPKAMAKLSDQQRQAVMLIHGLEWSLAEAAEMLGVGKSTVQTHLQRGMDRLRRDLGVEV